MDDPFVLPHSIQVGPYSYQLRRDPSVDAGGRFAESYKHPVRTIAFAEATNREEMVSTFVHELIHSVAVVYHVDRLEKKDGEDDVDRLANGITQALQSAGLLPERMILEGE